MDDRTKGCHLIVTGYVGDWAVPRLADKDFLAGLLVDLVRTVGMEILLPPQMVEVPVDPAKVGSPDDDGGVTGVAVLGTSHVSVHTWPLRRAVSFDLYSCHDFDPEKVFGVLLSKLGLADADVVDLDRTFPPKGGRFRIRVVSKDEVTEGWPSGSWRRS